LFKAIAVMPGTLAMRSNGGANKFGEAQSLLWIA
jgi:hypothetical protein